VRAYRCHVFRPKTLACFRSPLQVHDRLLNSWVQAKTVGIRASGPVNLLVHLLNGEVEKGDVLIQILPVSILILHSDTLPLVWDRLV
jgi:hypothetical protein